MHTTRPHSVAFSATAVGCTSPHEKGAGSESLSTIYAAIEDDGSLAELSGTTGAAVCTIDLSQQAHGRTVKGAPDGRMIWLTAKPESQGGHASGEPMPAQLIGVDTTTSPVSVRIDLGEALHAANVVTANERAYVIAYDADAGLVVDLAAKRVVRTIELPKGTHRHGARLLADASKLIVAVRGDGSNARHRHWHSHDQVKGVSRQCM